MAEIIILNDPESPTFDEVFLEFVEMVLSNEERK